MMDEEKYEKDDIYNADETDLNWHALPLHSLATRWEKSALGFTVR